MMLFSFWIFGVRLRLFFLVFMSSLRRVREMVYAGRARLSGSTLGRRGSLVAVRSQNATYGAFTGRGAPFGR